MSTSTPYRLSAPYEVFDFISRTWTPFQDIPDGDWEKKHATTQLVLQKMEPDERFGIESPIYIGVFEVSKTQYEWVVTGSQPSDLTQSQPVDNVSYNNIRGLVLGAQWPADKRIDDTSFMGKLRVMTGLDFDLPTEKQWECASRLGTTTATNGGRTGMGADTSLKLGNTESGDVWEWCLDWYTSLNVEPGIYRVLRGGRIVAHALTSRVEARWAAGPGFNYNTGFRVCVSASQIPPTE